MEFKKVLDRIEEVNDTIPYIIEQTQVLDGIVDDLLSNNIINDVESAQLSIHITQIRNAMDSINGK